MEVVGSWLGISFVFCYDNDVVCCLFIDNKKIVVLGFDIILGVGMVGRP